MGRELLDRHLFEVPYQLSRARRRQSPLLHAGSRRLSYLPSDRRRGTEDAAHHCLYDGFFFRVVEKNG
jgi:hypothetical protein